MGIYIALASSGVSRFGKDLYITLTLSLLVIAIVIAGIEIYLFYPTLIKAQYDSSVETVQYVLFVSNLPLAILAYLVNLRRNLLLKRQKVH